MKMKCVFYDNVSTGSVTHEDVAVAGEVVDLAVEEGEVVVAGEEEVVAEMVGEEAVTEERGVA